MAALAVPSHVTSPPMQFNHYRLYQVRVVSFSDWRKIESIERMKGEAIGKPAEKLTDVQCMLEAVS